MNISYCITVADEETEFFKLLNHLKPFLREGDEVNIKIDNSKVTENIYKSLQDLKFCKEYKIKTTICKIFNRNFSEWKNELIPNCKNPIIFFLDADELPNPQLLEDLPLIMELNPDVDIIGLPIIGQENYKYCIIKNNPQIKFEEKNKLIGTDKYLKFPKEVSFSILKYKSKK
jgi:predicted DNA-binding antitoxin AbrB/MazE fold protein